MPQISPYINFNGNAEEVFTFYKSVLGGEFTKIIRFKDLPSNPDFPIPASEDHKLMHIALPIGQGFLFANDIFEMMGRVDENENRSKIAITTENKKEANNLFDGLSKGVQVEMPMDENPDGTYFAMFRDKFGIEWIVKFDPKE